MFSTWSNTQKIFGVIALVSVIFLLLNWDKVWSWVKSLGGEVAPERIVSDIPSVPPQQVIQQTVVIPRPAPPTCAQIKSHIDHFAGLFVQYPNSLEIKRRLDQLKKQYADANCNGGPKPIPNVAA